MPSKRKTLPKDFEELLDKGDLEALKAVYDKCQLDAYGSYAKKSALGFENCPPDLIRWLVEQGADLQCKDTWGNSPLHNHADCREHNVELLIELGADIEAESNYGYTPLFAAASIYNMETTQLLIDHGANIHHRLEDEGLNVLEYTLQRCNNIDIGNAVAFTKLYFAAGLEPSEQMQEFVRRIGKDFEFHRPNFNKEYVEKTSNALDELYQLHNVEPVARRVMHDGKALIKVKTDTWQQQHQELWELLIPSGGAAQTVQGEVIRISGRISIELDGNGGINWDADFRRMADTWLEFVQTGTALPASDLTEAQSLVNDIKRKYGEPSRMCELAVKWVLANPKPVALGEVSYKR